MSEIQRDLVALDSFCGFHHEGLREYFFSSGHYFPILRDAMARHGFARTASALDKVWLLFPIGAADATPEDFLQHELFVMRTYGDRVQQFGKGIEQLKEDYRAAIDAIFRERTAELPEPLELLPGRWKTNPFDGKPIFHPPRYPL